MNTSSAPNTISLNRFRRSTIWAVEEQARSGLWVLDSKKNKLWHVMPRWNFPLNFPESHIIGISAFNRTKIGAVKALLISSPVVLTVNGAPVLQVKSDNGEIDEK